MAKLETVICIGSGLAMNKKRILGSWRRVGSGAHTFLEKPRSSVCFGALLAWPHASVRVMVDEILASDRPSVGAFGFEPLSSMG
jgi:hypothetical protein